MSFLAVSFEWRSVDIVDADGIVKRQRVMIPLARYGNLAASQFIEGERYDLTVQILRSMKAHRFYMASVGDAFDNLPESIAARWPSPTHLRRWCLCECGWFDETEFDCDSEANARKMATNVRMNDAYARISIHGFKVIARRAKSQAVGKMKDEDFKASSKAVLELLASMIGVSATTLKRENGRHA